MQLLQSWRNRAIIGAVIGVLALIVWVRFESRIAETPRTTESVASVLVNQVATPPPIVIPSAAEESRSNASKFLDSRSTLARDGAQHEEVGIASGRSPSALAMTKGGTVRFEMPFVSQAPFRVWDLPYKEFCEEAAVYTLYLWKEGKATPPADELDRALKDIQAWEIANLRTWEDTTADETARILKERFGYANTKVVRNVIVAQMKAEIDAKRPIIVPAAGRELSSPYYRAPGPLYHMLVIIGYDEARREFITNDVGTNTKGAGFRFTYDNLYGAMGDWDVARGAPDTSQKAMIVVE